MNYFLSGWAFPSNREATRSLDSTKIVAKYKSIENIRANFDEIFPPDIKKLTAWSMGSIMTLGLLDKIKAKKIILYSPAFNFAENEEEFTALQKLRENITQNKEVALKLFARKSGANRYLADINYYTTQELIAGLDFLKNTKLSPLQASENTEVIVVFGEKDKIISPKKSLEVAEKLRVKHIEIAGGNHSLEF